MTQCLKLVRTNGATPAMLRGDFGFYSVFEQKLYRVRGDDDRGIGIFARASYSPPDRNLIDHYADAGLEFIGLSDQRPKDKFGIAAAYAHVSPWARARDMDFQRLAGPGWPIRRFEGCLPLSTSTRYAPAGRCNRISSISCIPAEVRPLPWGTIPANH